VEIAVVIVPATSVVHGVQVVEDVAILVVQLVHVVQLGQKDHRDALGSVVILDQLVQLEEPVRLDQLVQLEEQVLLDQSDQ
jgi:hypothetical protein